MPRTRHIMPEYASDAPQPEPKAEAPVPDLEALAEAQRYETIGFGAHHEAAREAGEAEPEPEPDLPPAARSRVLTDTVTKFDSRTGGMPITFPPGTPVDTLPPWLAADVLDNPALTAEA